MARFLATLPVNIGLVNLETVQAYPEGGSGPTAYGPTSYYGSDPLPPYLGDSVNNPVNLGDFTPVYKALTISNSHGGLSRSQTTFYSFSLIKSRSIKLTQNFSQFATTSNTNRNTLVAFYKVEDGNNRRELVVNDDGYVVPDASVVDGGDGDEFPTFNPDYPTLMLDPGQYIFLITNDIRYLETTYSITIEGFVIDWRYVAEDVDDSLEFGLLTEGVGSTFDFGTLTTWPQSKIC